MSLQVGDTVIIEPLVEREIQSYIFGFNSIMNDYIGYKTKITSIYDKHSDGYRLECDNGQFVWSGIHLKLVPHTKMNLF